MSRPAKKQTKDCGSEVHSHTATFSLAEITGNSIDTPITTFVERVSADNRRRYREEVLVDPPSPVKRQRAAGTQPIQDFSRANVEFSAALEIYEMGFDLDDETRLAPDPPAPAALPRFSKPSVSLLSLPFALIASINVFYQRIRPSTDSATYTTPISAISYAVTGVFGLMPASDVHAAMPLQMPMTPRSIAARIVTATSCSAVRASWLPMVDLPCIG